ncbi:hypothetical protein HAX54_011251 [Datura stramonium]|uniref:Protein kinase domain-containing protein n=1 Tax=Datura stramonium TaxID=4076 RepID=A0ABS8TKB4_DATST|nr:hypothetical protein [Datura stramonium]
MASISVFDSKFPQQVLKETPLFQLLPFHLPNSEEKNREKENPYQRFFRITTSIMRPLRAAGSSSEQQDPSVSFPLPLSLTMSELTRVNCIGSGFGSSVYKVQHRPTGELYALKVISCIHEDSVRDQMCREIEIVLDVDNPVFRSGPVPIISFITHRGLQIVCIAGRVRPCSLLWLFSISVYVGRVGS